MKRKIIGLLLIFCITAIGVIPCIATANDAHTVTVNAGTGGQVSVGGKVWSNRVTVAIGNGETIGNRVMYRADEGYELDSVTSLTNVVAVVAGEDHTVILDDKGQVYTSGSNGFGERGIGDPEDLISFQTTTWYFAKVTNGIEGVKIKAIAAGQSHTVLLDEDGNVYTAGWNYRGQLGRDVSEYMQSKNNQPRDNLFTKVTVGDGTVKIKAIAAGTEHTVLVDENGKVWTAGYNYTGQLGRTLAGRLEYEAKFELAEGAVNDAFIVAAAAGVNHTVLLDDTGTVWTVGQDFYGANGQNGSRPRVFTKCSIEGNPKIAAVTSGYTHTVLLDEDGNVYTAGRNNFGQLGLGIADSSKNVFTKVTSGMDAVAKIVSVSAGENYTILTDANGMVYAAGDNQKGQLGIPLETQKCNTFSAVTVNGIGEDKIVSAATGRYHTILLDNTGKIWSAGYNGYDFPLGRLIKPYKSICPDFELAMSSPVLNEQIDDLSQFVVTGNSTVSISFKEREKVNITYILNSGKWVDDFTPQTFYYKGDSFTPPSLTNLTRTGYTAKEWKIRSQTDNSVTYSVVWEEKSGYTIRYDTKGGTTVSDKTNVKWNDEILDGIDAPTREGWEFIGWTCGGKTVDEDTYPCYCDFAENDGTMEITLEAVWKDIAQPVITGLDSDKIYCSSVRFTVTDNDGVESVRAGDEVLTADQNNEYIIPAGSGTVTVIAKDKTGNSSQITVTVNADHTYDWQSENGQYWQKCRFCQHETDKKEIPQIIITGAERVCKTQDYTFIVAVPASCKNVAAGYEFSDDNGSVNLIKNGEAYTATLQANLYMNFSSFIVTASAETEDGFVVIARKEITVLSNHTGGTATCAEKAKCDVCGADYNEKDADNHTDLRHFEAKAATKDAEGNIEYWYCSGCGRYFSDEAATEEITQEDTVTEKLKDDPDLPPTGDNSNMILWIMMLFISGGAVIVTALASKKKKYSAE